jgi:hypothetical protein
MPPPEDEIRYPGDRCDTLPANCALASSRKWFVIG